MIMKEALLGVFVVSAIVIAAGCITPPDVDPSGVNVTDNSSGIGLIEISEEILIEPGLCVERGLQDKVVVMESKYCGACRVAVPRLEEIEEELGASFIYLDLSESEDLETMKSFGVIPRYTPTTIIGCRVMIGAYDKEGFKNVIEPFWNSL
jgi:thiol-disulfide isomerase/thioredoxin